MAFFTLGFVYILVSGGVSLNKQVKFLFHNINATCQQLENIDAEKRGHTHLAFLLGCPLGHTDKRHQQPHSLLANEPTTVSCLYQAPGEGWPDKYQIVLFEQVSDTWLQYLSVGFPTSSSCLNVTVVCVVSFLLSSSRIPPPFFDVDNWYGHSLL